MATTKTINIIPTAYTISNSAITISNAASAYSIIGPSGSNSNYATIINTKTSASTSNDYLYLKGFNFSSIPANAIITDFSICWSATSAGYGAYRWGKTYSVPATEYVPQLGTNSGTSFTSCARIQSSTSSAALSESVSNPNTVQRVQMSASA